MASINSKNKSYPKTHEGAPAKRISAIQELRRTVLACMLWENQFYENGISISDRIVDLISRCDKSDVYKLAIEARNKMKLRHVPLLISSELAKWPCVSVRDLLSDIIQRPNELTEFLSIYWRNGKCPLSAQVKKGLAKAFTKFDAYSLAKYNRDNAIKLRDVLFLCHAKPNDKLQAETWKKLINGTLESPDTWEVALSTGEDKKLTWERLLSEKKLGGLALLRNLRNMNSVGVCHKIIKESILSMRTDRLLPFRFISAANHAPQFELQLEQSMLMCLDNMEKLPGKTILLVDVSGSMVGANVSKKSDIDRLDAACGLAILARELCEDIEILAFESKVWHVPARHGFALRDKLKEYYHGCTYLGAAVLEANKIGYDRLVVITDEQSQDTVPNPTHNGYMINVASYKNGVGYGKWTNITGWSENVFSYIIESEKQINLKE